MRLKMGLRIAAGVLVTVALLGPAAALDRPTTAQSRPPPPRKVSPSKLTKEDCGDLGGTVVKSEGVCLSGEACTAVGEDGNHYAVCIAKVKK